MGYRSVEEGDYLVDTWMNFGHLAFECKVEVKYNGGEDTIVYNSVGGSGSYNSRCLNEFYLGNGDKLHFTGNGNEYIKIMLDDDFKANSIVAQYFLIDSFRLTPWYDMNTVYDEFYGKDIITAGTPYITDGIINIDLESKYAMHKYGYDAYFIVFDEAGKLTNIAPRKNVTIYDGTDTKHTLRISLSALGIDLTGKTYKFVLWGSDAQPNDSNMMVPYIK